MSHHRVGVLRGGPSDEYEVSLKTGAAILSSLSQDKYHPIDIYIDKEGIWHVHGIPKSINDVLAHVDVIVNALHGKYGEDGQVQKLLDHHKIPYTGARTFASALSMNKVLSKDMYKRHGLKTPYGLHFEKMKHKIHDLAAHLFKTFPVPAIIKPAAGGSSQGVSIAHTIPELIEALEKAYAFGDTVLVEELINGTEATVGVIENFRDHELYVLPPIEIRPHKGKIFNFEGKYAGESDEIVPGNFTPEIKQKLEELAREAHKALGLRHYSRSDFIVTPRRGIYILETNTLPGLTNESLLPKALNAVGSGLPHFVDHIIELAIRDK